MSHRVLVIDTSILCCWLKIPGKETAGSGDEKWNFDRVEAILKREREKNSTFVLPLATLIETGNHIAQSSGDRHKLATELGKLLIASLTGESPWAIFGEQTILWESDALGDLAKNWPPLAAARLTIGDATIKEVADYYSRAGFRVEILTGDAGLKAYESPIILKMPRRGTRHQ